jgi:hypothetical protein
MISDFKETVEQAVKDSCQKFVESLNSFEQG